MRKIWKKWTGWSLVVRILCGMALGLLLGLLLPSWRWIGIFGSVFVGALKAAAPVLVALLVCASVAKAGKGQGPRFRLVILLYMMSSFFAALIAVSGSFLFPVTLRLQDAAAETAPGSLHDVFYTLITNVVMNPVRALAEANYVGILFWSIVIGLALKAAAAEKTIRVVGDFADAVSKLVGWIIQFAPFGIMGLVYAAVQVSGLAVFTTYGRLLLLLVGCMLTTALIINPLIHFVLLRKNPYPLLWTCLRESGVNAFFTRSSAANIPINMDLCKRLGLDPEFYSVSIPLGATVNMSGAAVTITVLALAVAHTVGVPVTFASALVLAVVSTLGACGASGVAGGSLLLVPMACSFFGISQDVAMQAVAVGFIIGVIQDSVETALNSSADVFFTATAEWHGRGRYFTSTTE